MQIKEINSTETLELRHKILRPSFSLSECSYPGDDDRSTYHLGAFLNNNLVGIVSVYCKSHLNIQNGQGYQVRAMAVIESVRGGGVGLKLLSEAESLAFGAGAKYIWANARVSAIDFYKKAAYKVIGDEFYVKGVGSHFLVTKSHSNFN